MTGNNTPVFFIRDPLKFPDFIHTQKRDPRTNLRRTRICLGLLVAHAGVHSTRSRSSSPTAARRKATAT